MDPAPKTDIRTYRDLIVWQKSMLLAEQVYRVTAGFSEAEKYGLTAQMRRSAVSVAANIAEGYGRGRQGGFPPVPGHQPGEPL